MLKRLFQQVLNYHHLMISLQLFYFLEIQPAPTVYKTISHQMINIKYKFPVKVRRGYILFFPLLSKLLFRFQLVNRGWCILNFSHKLTLKNKGRSWSCSVTAVEKDLPALAISHFNTIWKHTQNQSLLYSQRAKSRIIL